jgi:hypothetical protein
MKISWLDISEVKAYSETLVEDLNRAQSSGIARGDKYAQLAKRVDRLLDGAITFEREKQLNIYKKAQLITMVKQGLEGKGWSREAIATVANRLTTHRLRRTATVNDKS